MKIGDLKLDPVDLNLNGNTLTISQSDREKRQWLVGSYEYPHIFTRSGNLKLGIIDVLKSIKQHQREERL